MFKPKSIFGAGAMALAIVSATPAHAAGPGPTADGVVATNPTVSLFSTLVFVQVDPVTGKFTTRFFPSLFGQYMQAQSSGNGGVVTFTTPTKTGYAQIAASIAPVNVSNTLGSGTNSLSAESLVGAITTSTDPRLKAGVGLIYIDSYAKATGLSYANFGVWGAKKRFHSNNPIYAGAWAGPSPGKIFTTTMPTSGTAIYNGKAVGLVNINGDGRDWLGTVSLTANFNGAGGNIEGSINGIGVYKQGTILVGTLNDLNLNLTSFSKKTFFGTVSAGSTAGTAANLTGGAGLYKGAFFGPSAAEVAGILHFSTSTVFLTGSFGAKQ